MQYMVLAGYAAAGALVGAVYFLLLYRSVRLYATGAGAAKVTPLYLLRYAIAVAAFWFIAHAGAMPLLLALAGFLAARHGAQNLVERRAEWT